MACAIGKNVIVCYSPSHRIRLSDGRHVFFTYHEYIGPMGFYKDKNERREIKEWWEDRAICDALNWFCNRGNKC